MSHFTVLVIGKNPEKQLEKYDENLDVPEYKNKEGEMTTYNPDSKWDWYELGGRWTGYFKTKNGEGKLGNPGVFKNLPEFDADQCLVKELDGEVLPTFAVVKEGEWFERGEMGWWGMVADEKDDELWEYEFKNLVKNLPPDTLLSLFDCHI